MFIRRKPNKNGSFSVQVFDKRGGHNVLLCPFSSSKDEAELNFMEQKTADFIASYGGQWGLDFNESLPPLPEEEAETFFNRIIDVKQDAPRIILGRVDDGIGFGVIKDDTLRSLAIARVCEPRSKVATVEYLKRCFREDYHLHQIYRCTRSTITQRERMCCAHRAFLKTVKRPSRRLCWGCLSAATNIPYHTIFSTAHNTKVARRYQ